MTKRLAVASALVLGAFAATPLLAQTSTTPTTPSRADVKADVPPASERMKDQNITGERMPTADQLPPKPKKGSGAATTKRTSDVPPASERMKDQAITGERMPTADQLPPKPKKGADAPK